MSFVVGSLHPPSLITSAATANIGYDALILSRGNEILISDITDKCVSKPKIYPFFGNILLICSYDTNKLAILFETEKLLLFELIPNQLHCLSQYTFDYKIGRRVLAPQFSASNSLIICHTRVRTIQVIIPDQSLSFTQYLQFIEIYSIKCFDDSMQFIIFGKNLNNIYHVGLYEVGDKVVNQINSISFPDCESRASILILSPSRFYISLNDKVELYTDFDQKTDFYSHNKEITSLFQINKDTIALCDIKNKVFNITSQHEMITLDGIDQIIPIGHDFYLELSKEDDSHLLKYEHSILKVADTYAQLNCTCFMDRSQIITKSGIIRTFVNGSATAEQIKIEINCGKNIWFVFNKYIVISTFDSTVVLESNKFEQVEVNFESDSETLSIIQTEKNVIQITSNKIRLLTFDDQNDMDPTFSDITFDKQAILASCFRKSFVVAFEDNSIDFYTFSEEDSKLNCNSSFNVQNEVSALALTEKCISVSFWHVSTIQIFDLDSFEMVGQLSIENEKENFVSSLIYENESDNKILIAGCSNGDLYIFNLETDKKEEYQMVKIHVSTSSIKLKRIQGKILIISDVSAFLHKQTHFTEEEDKSHNIEDCEYSIEFISVSASFDATEILGKIAFISSNGVTILSIESHHHSHIEDRSATFNKITLISIDETNRCPIVYSIKPGPKSGSNSYTLFANGLQPFKLTIEIPRCMIWFFHGSDYYLIVGCDFEKSGRLIVFNSKLEKLSVTELTHPIDCICSVLNTYVAVASGQTLKGFILDDEKKLVCKCSINTRKKCASLTSPNSIAVIYADKVASVSIYKMCDNQVVLIASDVNPKALKFARMESETDILAIGDNSIIYNLSLNDSAILKTKAAFNINCDVSAVFCSPKLAFITKSGSMQVIMKMDEIFVKIFNVMKNKVKGLGGLNIDEFRSVRNNGNKFDTGNFVDGDFVRLFDMLPDSLQIHIARAVGVDVAVIKNYIKKYNDELVAYREISQTHPRY